MGTYRWAALVILTAGLMSPMTTLADTGATCGIAIHMVPSKDGYRSTSGETHCAGLLGSTLAMSDVFSRVNARRSETGRCSGPVAGRLIVSARSSAEWGPFVRRVVVRGRFMTSDLGAVARPLTGSAVSDIDVVALSGWATWTTEKRGVCRSAGTLRLTLALTHAAPSR